MNDICKKTNSIEFNYHTKGGLGMNLVERELLNQIKKALNALWIQSLSHIY
jgi:hypothetical protein